MATFATKDTNTTDIDPDSLTVNLLGPEPDPDDLVIKPANVTAPESEQIDDAKDEAVEESAESADSAAVDAEDESMDKILKAQKPVIVNPTVDDEIEIKAIEDMLRSKKSKRIKKQITQSQPMNIAKTPGKRKIDPIVIVSGIVAAALIVVFVAYFLGMFDTSNTLRMTVDEFSAAYAKTSAYKAISGYGFAFPAVTFAEETTAATDASVTPTPSVTRVPVVTRDFTQDVSNTVNYQFALTGSVSKSNSNLTELHAVMVMQDQASFKEVLIVFAPYIQVLYPSMSKEDATALLSTLLSATDPVTVKGNYGLSMGIGSTGSSTSGGGSYYCSLSIMTAKDAKKYLADVEAAASAAATTATTAAA